jgi:hypothetical protein
METATTPVVNQLNAEQRERDANADEDDEHFEERHPEWPRVLAVGDP